MSWKEKFSGEGRLGELDLFMGDFWFFFMLGGLGAALTRTGCDEEVD